MSNLIYFDAAGVDSRHIHTSDAAVVRAWYARLRSRVQHPVSITAIKAQPNSRISKSKPEDARCDGVEFFGWRDIDDESKFVPFARQSITGNPIDTHWSGMLEELHRLGFMHPTHRTPPPGDPALWLSELTGGDSWLLVPDEICMYEHVDLDPNPYKGAIWYDPAPSVEQLRPVLARLSRRKKQKTTDESQPDP